MPCRFDMTRRDNSTGAFVFDVLSFLIVHGITSFSCVDGQLTWACGEKRSHKTHSRFGTNSDIIHSTSVSGLYYETSFLSTCNASI